MRRLARPLLYLGVVGVVLGLSKLHASVVADPPYDYTSSSRFAWSIGYMALLAVAAYGAGLPDVPRSARSAVATSVAAAGAAAAGVSFLQLLVGDALLPRFVVFGSALALVPWYLACAAVASRGHERAAAADRVLVVGAPEDARAVTEGLEAHPERPASVVDVVAPEVVDQEREGMLIKRAIDHDVNVVVLDRRSQASARAIAEAAALHERGIRVRTLSLFHEEWLGRLPLAELERVSLMFDIGELHRQRYGRVKRLVDLVVVVPGLVALAVATPLVVAANLFGNRGPLLFRQPRVGRRGQVFDILKFRTMVPSDDAAGGWTTDDDPRVTPVGRVLRRTHLDELPQMVNILKGDLTLVGPRPEQPHYVAELVERLPFYDLRHLVRPGLTGWAQVKYHYGANEQDATEKLQYEFYYLRHQGLALDLRIIGRTVRSVLGGGGR